MNFILKRIIYFTLHLYSIFICFGAILSIPITSYLFHTFSKLTAFIFHKNPNNGFLFILPFQSYNSWKEYITLLKSYIRESSFSETQSMLYYKFKIWNPNNKMQLPYFKFPKIESNYLFYNSVNFPELTTLIESKNVILNEYLEATNKLKYYVNEAGKEHSDWQTILLYGSGFLNEKVKDKFPITLSILNKIKGIDFSMILFSVLKPGAHIPIHSGPYNAFLKIHLPLILPIAYQNCTITVGSETKHWTENELLIFDDCYEHTVTNNTTETRVILMLAIEKKDIPINIKPLIHKFIKQLNESTPFKQWMINNT